MIENFTDNSLELYHLATDPGEKVNLADQRTAKRTAMLDQLVTWRKNIGATKTRRGVKPLRLARMLGEDCRAMTIQKMAAAVVTAVFALSGGLVMGAE